MTKAMGVLLGLCLLFAPGAWGVEPLSTEELLSHCKYYPEEGYEADRIFCVRYIQGFIDGAVATDENVMRNVSEQYEDRESFSERASRTRIGSRLKLYGATVYAEFCLGAPVPLKEVVEHVVEDARNEELVASYDLARDLVYYSLRDHYPCE
jgi:hypothetical protein